MHTPKLRPSKSTDEVVTASDASGTANITKKNVHGKT